MKLDMDRYSWDGRLQRYTAQAVFQGQYDVETVHEIAIDGARPLLAFQIRKRGARRLLKASSHLRRIGIREVRALDHENVDALRAGINPCLGAIGAAVAERAR